MNDPSMARRRMDKIHGGNVSYYLIEMTDSRTGETIIIEIGDAIEVLEMLFDEATIFKSTVRLCKDRMGLGKPGSTPLYEAQKVQYSASRTLAIAPHRTIGCAPRVVGGLVTIERPKRLEPYSFLIRDMISAIDPTHAEAETLGALFDQRQCVATGDRGGAIAEAARLDDAARRVLAENTPA